VSLRLGRWDENWETSTDRLRVTERASFANLLKPKRKELINCILKSSFQTNKIKDVELMNASTWNVQKYGYTPNILFQKYNYNFSGIRDYLYNKIKILQNFQQWQNNAQLA
jgi:hypothetical protein